MVSHLQDVDFASLSDGDDLPPISSGDGRRERRGKQLARQHTDASLSVQSESLDPPEPVRRQERALSPMGSSARRAARRDQKAKSSSHRARSEEIPRRGRAQRSDEDCGRRSHSLPSIACTLCPRPILPSHRRWRGTRNAHEECGLAMQSGMTKVKKIPGADVEAFKSLLDDPYKAERVLSPLRIDAPGEKRDMSSFVEIVTETLRKREFSQLDDELECDYKEFVKHWEQRGRGPKSIKKKWTQHTTPAKFRENKAFYRGKKIIVKVKEQRRHRNADSVSKTVKAPSVSVMGSRETANQMVSAKEGIQFLDREKAMLRETGLAFEVQSEAESTDEDVPEAEMQAPGDDAGGKPKKKKRKRSRSSSSSSDSTSSASPAKDVDVGTLLNCLCTVFKLF